MSSTSNAQDLLVNVFRPTYRWDSTTGFVPSLTVSNVTEIITGSVQTARLAVTDTNLNTYIGRDAGASATDTASNVGLGYSAMAGAVNSSNNVAVGMFSLDGMSNSDSNVALGARTDITGRGQRNVLIGPNVTMGDGSGNILIGADISAGNVSKRFQLGTLLYGDLSSGYVGINTSTPAAALDISGIVVFRNKVGFQNPNPDYSLDVAGSVFASEQIIGGKGTQSNPMYTFKDTPGSGMYIPVDPSYGTGSFAIAVNQKPAAIFSSNAVNFFQNLDVSGTFSARNIDISAFSVTNGTPGIPSVTFTNDTSTGLYLAASNRLGVTTGGFRRMEVLSDGDVSMGRLVTKDISYSGTIVGTDPNTCNVIGGVTLCNGNVILTGTATNSNLLVPGWIRNTTTAFVLDISSGNISNSLTTRSSNFRASAGTAGAPAYSFASDATTGVHSAGTSQLAFDTAGVQRMVISNGNVGIGKATPVVALEVVGDVSATTYNGPGGTQSAPHYTFSDDRTTGLFFPGANMIGLSAGGTERVRISNSNIGIGTTAPTNALDVSGTLRVIGTAGDLTFTNGTISLAGVPVISSTGVLSNATNTSNSIGGVTLSNTNIAYAGAITGSTAGASNRIGGVTLSNTNITYAGAITGGTDGTSNRIGGVTLSNTNIAYAGTITGSTDDTSNRIGGVTLSNTNITVTGTTTSSNFRATGGGAAAFPAYSFSNATQTGMLHSGGFLQFANGGVTRFQISADTTTVSNQLAVTDGTAAAPGYAFTSDAGLGLFRPGANQLAFATGQSNRMVLSNSVLAIGRTPVADTSLIFQTPTNAYISTGRVYLGDAPNSTPAYGATIIEGLSNGGSGACDLLLYSRPAGSGVGSDPLERMRIVGSTGNVGIGTRTPGARMDISAGSGVGLRVSGVSSGGATALFDVSPDNGYSTVSTNGFFTIYKSGTTDKAQSNKLAQFAGDTGGVNYFLSNEVGIGTATPGNLLTVVAPSSIGWANRATRTTTNYQVVIADGGGTAPGLYMGSYYTGGQGAASTLQSSDSWNGTINPAPLLLNPVGGAVGIGFSTPTWALDVSGIIQTNTGLFACRIDDTVNNAVVAQASAFQAEFSSYKRSLTERNDILFRTTNNAAAPVRMQILGGNGFVGVGARSPEGNLHISSADSAANAANVLMMSTGSIKNGAYNEIQFRGLDGNGTVYLSAITGIDTGSGASPYQGELRFLTTQAANQTYERMRIRHDGRIGVGQTNPGYRLDVTSEATTAAAINASTWSRSAVSTSYYGVYNGQPDPPNAVVAWTTCNAINSDIMEVADNKGTYFRPKVSGIYNFSVWMGGSDAGAGNPMLTIDVSTNAAHAAKNVTNTPEIAANVNPQGHGRAGISWTGYLPAAAHYYKIKMTSLYSIASNATGGKIYVTFLGEVGSGSAQPW